MTGSLDPTRTNQLVSNAISNAILNSVTETYSPSFSDLQVPDIDFEETEDILRTLDSRIPETRSRSPAVQGDHNYGHQDQPPATSDVDAFLAETPLTTQSTNGQSNQS